MPCHVEPTDREIFESWESRLRHDSPVAEAFCQLCKHLDSCGFQWHGVPKAKAWWDEHRERDRKQAEDKAAEYNLKKTRAEILEKLSPAERAALGIFD